MVSAPAVTPVTTPVPNPIVPLPLLAVQVPPPASVNAVVKPTHTVRVPVMDAGSGFTVTTAVIIQPVAVNVYVIVAVPDAPVPVTRPVDEPTLAVPGALLLHTPPGVASLNEVVKPEQTASVPRIADGNGFTVTSAVIIQPVDDNV